MSMTEIRDADLRGFHTTGPEEAASKSKLLAAAAVILGLAAVGAYAYTSHSLLPSTPQKTVISQPIAMTPPPASPATTQPDTATPAPQVVAPAPEVQAPAPEVKAKAVAPQAPAKAKASQHVTHVRARTPESTSTPAATPPDTTVPAAPSQSVAPPNIDTTTPYTAAPVTTPQNTVTPQTAAPDTTTQQPQTTPDQGAPQPPSPQ
jgi:hypothetical protein